MTVAVRLVTDAGTVSDARVALGSAGPHPLRVGAAEAALAGRPLGEASIGDAAQAAADAVEPLADAIASDWYRRRMVGVFVRRALEELAQGVPGRAA